MKAAPAIARAVLAGVVSLALATAGAAQPSGWSPAPRESPAARPNNWMPAPKEKSKDNSKPVKPKTAKPKTAPKPDAKAKEAPAAAAQPTPVPPVSVQPQPGLPVPALPTLNAPAATTLAFPPAPGAKPEWPPNLGSDPAFAAFQYGHYGTAFKIASHRAEQQDDVKAMALLGELYSSGSGVRQDDAKAAEWYRRAADRGDRAAMFALAMLHMAGRAGGPVNREEAAKLLAAAARLEHPLSSYNLALLYMQGQLFPQDFTRAAELLRIAADAGVPEAQYALATLYKEGRGVPKDVAETARLLYLSAIADNIDAQVEYGIALFNGSGVAKNEPEAARFMLRAARKGSPIAQNRLAHILAAGRGMPADPVQAIKWHLISKAGGASDLNLDIFMRQQKPETIAAAEKAALASIEVIRLSREPRS